MSLEIDPACVTAVFALGQWHYVALGTFDCRSKSIFIPLDWDEENTLGATWEAQCGSQLAISLSEIKAFKFDKTNK